MEDYIARNLVRASTTKMAQSRRKQLEKLEITEAPRSGPQELKFRFEFDVTPYNELLTLKRLAIKIGERTLLEPFDLQILRGERLVIAGPNGAGKSPLLQVLDGRRRPSGGMVRLGTGAKASIFEQQQLRRGGRVIDAIWDKWPRFTELEVRSHLARFGFKGEDVFKPVSALSGGEQSRLRLCMLMDAQINLLILDEPTRGIDIGTKTEIQKMVIQLAREQHMSIIFISSEIDEMTRTCTRLAVLRDRRKVAELTGDDINSDRVMAAIAGGA